jgi:hypothetical protein
MNTYYSTVLFIPGKVLTLSLSSRTDGYLLSPSLAIFEGIYVYRLQYALGLSGYLSWKFLPE